MNDKPLVTPISPGFPPPGGYAPVPQPPRRSALGGCFALFATVGLGFSLLLNLVLIGAKAGGVETQGPSAYHEKTIEGEGDAKILLVKVEGIIAEHPDSGGFLGAAGESLPKRIHDQLDKAKKDPEVKAVILEVDSPGGTVTASDEIWNELILFRDGKPSAINSGSTATAAPAGAGKPLLVHQASLAASGGYYISAAGDEIWASPTTITGSIGVIMQAMNASKFLHEHGITDVTITSGPNKDLLNPFSEPKDSHREILQATVDDMYARFCDVVADGIAHRTKKAHADVLPDVKKLADGRIYTSKQAVDLKLVDRIGYLSDVFEAAKKRAGVPQAKLIRYSKQPSLMDVFSGNLDAKLDLGKGLSVRVDPALLDELRSPRLLMLWRGE